MLLPDSLYKRTPQLWMLAGILSLILASAVGSEFKLFPAYIAFGVFGIVRSIWVYQARWKVSHKNRMSIVRGPRVVQHDNTRGPDDAN